MENHDIRFLVDRVEVSVSPTREMMGRIGAKEIGAKIKEHLEKKDVINMIFASAPSQLDVLNNLISDPTIPWNRINAFHMDEYIGMPPDAPQSFANYIREHLFSKVELNSEYYINGLAENIEAECERYEKLLKEHPVDISILGIGENGHLAFNDPHIADFNDDKKVKINHNLDETCRSQQVTDGWFKSIRDVPESAITLTIPALLSAEDIFTIVPGEYKSEMVKNCLEKEINPKYPGSIIRTHQSSKLFLDADSASKLDLENYAKLE